MGTRADFYIRQNNSLVWLGSVAYDGYDVYEEYNDLCSSIKNANEETTFLLSLSSYFKKEHSEDHTDPSQGWPWPWIDSKTTDYTYVFEKDHVECYTFGERIISPADEPELLTEVVESDFFPNMSDEQNVTLGKRSGILIFG